MSGGRPVLPAILLLVYLAEFSVLAIHPYNRNVWIVENTPIVLIVVFLVVTHRSFQFSNLAYLLMSALLFLHTIGGHYTFERVPFDCVTNLIGAQRNHFDCVAHYRIDIVEAGESSFAKVFASAKTSAWAKATADAMAGKLSVTTSVVRYSLDTRCAAS